MVLQNPPIIYTHAVYWHPSSPKRCSQKETPWKMENQYLITPSRQCSSTTVGFSRGFLSKEQCDNIGVSFILTWLQLTYLLPGLKSALKGQRFCNATDIIKNATEELKRLSRKGFQECFQHIYSRWQKCIVAEMYYFWRKWSWSDYSIMHCSEHFAATTYQKARLFRRFAS